MKSHLIKISTAPTQSFSIRQDKVPFINNRWHYHPELELIHIRQGEGLQFVGDSIQRFCSGDLLLIGSNLSHYWRFDDAYFGEDPKLKADVCVAHFGENFWGETFSNLPENKLIKATLEKAKLGMQITGKTRQTVGRLLDESLQADGARRIILLLEILDLISRSSQTQMLSSIGFKMKLEKAEEERIGRIYEYSLANFRNKIELQEIASVAYLSHNSFCRYFKSKTRKTYSQFLIEIRVGQACKLIMENRLDMKQVCYESGFNNLTSFYKCFKKITGKSPLLYQREFLHSG
ncbi:AraC family transcriptional regulator [Pontibacter ramchanderi]|uniref:Helix-turn-helix protein n=1 Tax=Pontibacter ramchanderi TaxID=1179743 RepID=A0A2N3U847_9BACT|nr:AraC family transcriptional regulator [Pontibacter ramchanderi]PKV62930.1 helix-turn-helix protein [Pontibacter ramchanderi]